MYQFSYQELIKLLKLFKVQFNNPDTGECTEDPCN